MKPQNIVRQAGQAAKQTGQSLAQIAAQNAKLTGESIKAQVGGPASEKSMGSEFDEFENDMPSIATPQEPQLDVNRIHAQDRAMLAELESKLAQIRQQEAQKLKEYKENVDQEMQQKNQQQAQTESVEPQGKVKKAIGKVKKAVKQVLGRKQSETKQGSGKG